MFATTAAAIVVRLGDDEQPVDELGNGRGVDGGGDDEDLVDVGRDRPSAASLGHPALEQRGPRLDGDDAVQLARGIVLQPDPVAHDDLGCIPFGLPAEHGANLPLRGGHPIDRAVPLQHRAEKLAHHSAGARAIASSRAVFTS